MILLEEADLSSYSNGVDYEDDEDDGGDGVWVGGEHLISGDHAEFMGDEEASDRAAVEEGEQMMDDDENEDATTPTLDDAPRHGGAAGGWGRPSHYRQQQQATAVDYDHDEEEGEEEGEEEEVGTVVHRDHGVHGAHGVHETHRPRGLHGPGGFMWPMGSMGSAGILACFVANHPFIFRNEWHPPRPMRLYRTTADGEPKLRRWPRSWRRRTDHCSHWLPAPANHPLLAWWVLLLAVDEG